MRTMMRQMLPVTVLVAVFHNNPVSAQYAGICYGGCDVRDSPELTVIGQGIYTAIALVPVVIDLIRISAGARDARWFAWYQMITGVVTLGISVSAIALFAPVQNNDAVFTGVVSVIGLYDLIRGGFVLTQIPARAPRPSRLHQHAVERQRAN